VVGGRPHRLSIEQDPIEVLRMGIPFDTCLSLEGEGGCNAASTVVNAADANKRVIYLRDPGGRIVARKLVAVSTEDTLLGYRLYIAAGDHEAPVTAAFRAFCQELSAAARLPLSAKGEPEQIHPGFWYDDGALPFDAPPEDAPVKAYCRSLGLDPPARPDADLRERARLFGAMRRGDREAVAAELRENWRAAGIWGRAAEWLLDRIDDPIAEARRAPLVATIAVARAAREGPVPMLGLAGRIADQRSAAEAMDHLLRAPRTAALARTLVAVALQSISRAREDNDGHGLDHQALDALPAFAGALPLAEALALCDRADVLLRRVADQGCPDCAAHAGRHIVDAIERAYASSRDPEVVVHVLGSARGSILSARAALRLAARYALTGDAAPALPPPRLQPVQPCPAALRAIAKLRARAPELDGDPDMLAAVLRQTGGVPREGRMPAPREAPFDALGDLLVQLDLEAIVAPFCGDDPPLSTWRPCRWELHHHRRHRTDRRRALAEGPLQGSAAAETCATLGRLADVDALRALLRAPSQHRRYAGEPLALVIEHALARAEHLAAQAEAARGPDPLGAVEALGLDTSVDDVDPIIVLAALERVEHRLAGRAADGGFAFDLLGYDLAGSHLVSKELAVHLAARLAALGSLSSRESAFVRNTLRDRAQHLNGMMVPDLAAAFGPHAAVHAHLSVALLEIGTFDVVFPAVEAALARAGHAAAADDLLPALAAIAASNHTHSLVDVTDEGLFRRIVRALVEARRPDAVLAIYRRLSAPEQVVIVLDELSRIPLLSRQKLSETLAALRSSDDTILADWLQGACCFTGPPDLVRGSE
jgi:hypothetical protein